MPSTVPPNFVDLNTASSCLNAEVNVMGVVTDFLPPSRTNGPDWMCTFSITDSSYSGIYDQGLKIRFFKSMENEMPAIKRAGDVIVIRFLKIKPWSGMTIGLSNRGTTWAVFPADSIPAKPPTSPFQLRHVKEPRAPVPLLAEMQYAVSLCGSCDRSTFAEPSSMPASTPIASSPSGVGTANRAWRDKFSLVKDAVSDTYYDLVGQVVKIYSHNDRVEIYLTDYTSNSLLFNYERGQDDEDGSGREGDEYNYFPRNSTNKRWPGPFGKMALTVTLWPPHAYFGRQNLKENDFVHLRNVHVKFSKDAKLEGVLHSDRRYPDRIDVTILKNNENDDRVKDVLRRKRDYAKKFQISSVDLVAEARGLKRKEMDGSKPLTKNGQRKKRKQEKELLAKSIGQITDQARNKENSAKPAIKEQSSKKAPPSKVGKQDLNKNVNCSHHLIKPRSLSSIASFEKHTNTSPGGTPYTLPFQNINSRATVRVIDFFPPDLVDFAVRCPVSSEFDVLSQSGDNQGESESQSQSSDLDSDSEGERPWEWRFGLVLEDATGPKSEEKATIEVYVVGQDAECLLKLDAEDLRKSSTALADLREKLFLLWGDLEERKARKSTILTQIDGNSQPTKKEESQKSKAFQCCLKEYGVKTKIQRSVEREDSESEDEHANEKDDWVWERRWRMFGTTII